MPFNSAQHSQRLNARETCICFWTSLPRGRVPFDTLRQIMIYFAQFNESQSQ